MPGTPTEPPMSDGGRSKTETCSHSDHVARPIIPQPGDPESEANLKLK